VGRAETFSPSPVDSGQRTDAADRLGAEALVRAAVDGDAGHCLARACSYPVDTGARRTPQ